MAPEVMEQVSGYDFKVSIFLVDLWTLSLFLFSCACRRVREIGCIV